MMPVVQGAGGHAITHRRPFCIECGHYKAEVCQCSGEQTKRSSLAEALINTFVGYGIALAGQLVVFPLFGIHISLTDNLLIGCIFMGISVARSYVIRRVMERLRVMGVMP
jgi:hypothetical protein